MAGVSWGGTQNEDDGNRSPYILPRTRQDELRVKGLNESRGQLESLGVIHLPPHPLGKGHRMLIGLHFAFGREDTAWLKTSLNLGNIPVIAQTLLLACLP